TDAPAAPLPEPPRVTVSAPMQETVASTTGFLGQFSAVDAVELRAQVGGTLTVIAFQDGQVVRRGDPLFVIDPRPFQIKLDQAVASLALQQFVPDSSLEGSGFEPSVPPPEIVVDPGGSRRDHRA